MPISASYDRCVKCRSPRLIKHPELFDLTIAHLDCDAFYAAVEKRDNPELVDKPVIIGGGRRGVVSTACYIARINGVHSAQPMFKALAACPDAVVIKPNMEKYIKVGREVREAMKELTPLVEPISIDEAFLDLTGTERLHGLSAAETLVQLVDRVQSDLGITISVGLSFNKFLAKVASDLEKPRGFSVIGKEEALDFLAKQSPKIIWGVGKAMLKKLSQDGIQTIGQIQSMEESDLAKRYGAMGLHIHKLSLAKDSRTVSPNRAAKSVSSETTFNTDIANYRELLPILRKLSEKVSRQLKTKALSGHTVVLKLKSADFKIKTRNRKLTEPTQLGDKIFRIADELLKAQCDGTAYRLIGVGVSDLYPGDIADQDDLVDETSTKRAHIERAMDQVRGKFGQEVIKHGLIFDPDKDH